jgi:Winged helix-turn helix
MSWRGHAPYALKCYLMVNTIKQALEQRLGRKVALSSVYTLLHRHGSRKLAPDERHPKPRLLRKVFSVGIAIER